MFLSRCKILGNNIFKWRNIVPYYCNKKICLENKLGLIVKPKEWWRKITLGKLPYFAYRHINLEISMIIHDLGGWGYNRIWEHYPFRGKIKHEWEPNIDENKNKIELDFTSTYEISKDGDVIFQLKGFGKTDPTETLFSCKIINTDTFIIQVLLILISSIISIALMIFT